MILDNRSVQRIVSYLPATNDFKVSRDCDRRAAGVKYRSAPDNQRVELSVADLPPGDYLLTAQLGDGAGGRVGYALLQGYTTPVLIAAILVGIGVGAALALVVLIIG